MNFGKLKVRVRARVCLIKYALNIGGMKVQVKRALRSYCLSQKSNKKVDRFCMKFSSVSITSVQRCLYPLFQNHRSHFLLFHLFFCCFIKESPKSQVRMNKTINKHTVDYHPSPSSLTSRIHHLIFLWTPKGFISPEYSLNFFFKPVYLSPWLMKSFEFTVLRLLENTFVSQKIESVHFYSCTQAKLSSRFLSSQIHAELTYLFPPNHDFWKSILTKWPKLNLQGYWSQVLINSTIFATFTFLVSVLLCHNLDSSLLKCEGSLT